MNLRLLVLVPLALIQLAVPGWMIYRQEEILQQGREFKFKTAPVDPYDAFRGRYVELSFDAEKTSIKAKPFDDYRRGWVQFEVDEHGFARVKRLSKTPLEGNDVVAMTSWWVGTNADNTIQLSFPFDHYYMDENSASKAETAYRDNSRREHQNAYATVRILNGRAAIEELYIDDKPIRDFLRTETKK